jgi:hypothetical protein
MEIAAESAAGSHVGNTKIQEPKKQEPKKEYKKFKFQRPPNFGGL